MKRLLCALFVGVWSVAQMFAAEPGNNLNKTLAQIQREFPDCIYWCDSGRGKYYKTIGEGFPIMFEIQKGKVISEFMLIEGSGSFPKDWFVATVNAFSKTEYTSVLPYDGTFYSFSYSYFTINIRYDSLGNSASITYELMPYLID